MEIIKSNDKSYPYIIKDSWGDKVYCTIANLEEIHKKINEILEEEKKLLTNH